MTTLLLSIAVAILIMKYIVIPAGVKLGWKYILTPITYDTMEEWLNDDPQRSKKYRKYRLGIKLIGARNNDVVPVLIGVRSGEDIPDSVFQEWQERMLR